MELKNITQIEQAARFSRFELFRLGSALVFIVGIMLYAGMSMGGHPGGFMLVAAAMIGGYMAMNIGANDVANNVGPAVGSRALTLAGAIVIAAIFEASGALVAGGDVVSTIKKGIIDPALITDSDTFIWLMMAALLAGAIWLNITPLSAVCWGRASPRAVSVSPTGEPWARLPPAGLSRRCLAELSRRRFFT
jgi:PiT family inorganic phosphate transporter